MALISCPGCHAPLEYCECDQSWDFDEDDSKDELEVEYD
jgi:hypothetical protein